MMEMPTVYIAGPMIFDRDCHIFFEQAKSILSACHLNGVAPIDNQIGLEGLEPGLELARRIFDADESLMNKVDAAIFCLDPFRRGTEMDAGTAYEIGYCRALGIPMAGWTSDTRLYHRKVVDHIPETELEFLQDSRDPFAQGGKSGEFRDADGVLIHSEGLLQNLMVEMSIRAAGGDVFASDEWSVAFTNAARSLYNQIHLITSSSRQVGIA